MTSSTMKRLGNHLPQACVDFPTPWIAEFQLKLLRSGLRRVGIVATTLIVLESILLAVDVVRLQAAAPYSHALLIWRVTVLVFLLSYRLVLEKRMSEPLRLRYFLGFGMALSAWVGALMARQSGDVSSFAIGALGLAVCCPLPGRFNASLFTLTGAALMAWLVWQAPAIGLHALSNIVAACVIGIVIEHLSYQAALRDFSQRKLIERQRERADTLLYNVFPESVASALKAGSRSVAMHGEVTILFADVVGFTQLSTRLLPSQLLAVLEQLFDQFDRCAQRHGVEKVKTIGDAYMAITGAPVTIDRPVERMAGFALDILQACRDFSAQNELELAVRIGIHCGPVIAGVIGRSRLCYDLWGDSVNTAQRIESHGQPNAINVSEPVYHALRRHYRFEDRGLIELKGKGPTRSFVLLGRRAEAPA